MILPRQLCALLRLGIGGVGHDAVELHDALAGGVQNAHDLIIHAIALDGAAAIRQHDGFPVVHQQTAEVLFHAALAEIHLGLVFKNKVVHVPLPPVSFQTLPPILSPAAPNRLRCCHGWKVPHRSARLPPVPALQYGLNAAVWVGVVSTGSCGSRAPQPLSRSAVQNSGAEKHPSFISSSAFS